MITSTPPLHYCAQKTGDQALELPLLQIILELFMKSWKLLLLPPSLITGPKKKIERILSHLARPSLTPSATWTQRIRLVYSMP